MQSSFISLLCCGGSAYVIAPIVSALPLAFLVCGPALTKFDRAAVVLNSYGFLETWQ